MDKNLRDMQEKNHFKVCVTIIIVREWSVIRLYLNSVSFNRVRKYFIFHRYYYSSFVVTFNLILGYWIYEIIYDDIRFKFCRNN